MMITGKEFTFKINDLVSGFLRWMPTPRSLPGAVLCLILGASASSTEEQSTLYNLGKAAAFARYCGHAGLALKARENFGGYRDFKKGLDQNLLPESYIWDVDCEELEERLTTYFEEAEARSIEFPKGHPKAHVTLNAGERDLIEQQVYNDLVSEILSEDGTWDDHQGGGGNAPIATYKDFVQGRINVKNLVACLKWDKESKTIGYLTWKAHVRRGWRRSQDFTMQQCNLARKQGELDCGCRAIDHGGESVLVLPDHILTAYKRRMDAASNGIKPED